MAITINSNISSLTTQRRLGNTTAELGRSYERLSSGLRINRASDDAAGLAIASSLNADNRVFNQGIRNLNDGLSLLNVADGALTELSNIVIRIRELAEQSANGTLSYQQRLAIDQEAQELSDEFTRIAQTTEVNGLGLFDGSLGALSLQAGYGERGAMSSTLGGTIGDGTFSLAASYASGDGPEFISAADFNDDGILDLATANSTDRTFTIFLGAGDGSFSQGISNSRVSSGSLTVGDFNGDGTLDLATDDFFNDTLAVFLGRGDGGFSNATSYSVGDSPTDLTSGDFNGDGYLDLASADSDGDTVSVLLNTGNGSFSQSTSFVVGVGNEPWAIASVDLNADGKLDIVTAENSTATVSVLLGLGDGGFSEATSFALGSGASSIAFGDFNGDGTIDIATDAYLDDTVNVLFGVGDGGFGQVRSFDVGNAPFSIASGDFNGDGLTDLVSGNYYYDNTLSVLLSSGGGGFEQAVPYAVGDSPASIASADFNGDGVLDLAGTNFQDDTVSILIGNSTSGVGPLLPFSLTTKADALQAMAPLDRKIEQLALQKGTIGAFQSRIASAISNLQITITNVKAAESRISDVDVAFESAKLVRLNILQQAGTAVLAQANQTPSLVLQLLG